ncbi:MAG: hypothetical protein Q9167_001335 [Letrouitia subvulpina]
MDGISVAASIVGLLAAAAKISMVLNDFITKVREAPKLARTVLLEIADISACLNQVQSLLLGAGKVNVSNQSLLMVDEVVVVLSNCVVIFSELEELAESLKPDQPIKPIDILKWTMKEKAVTALLLRLQSSKTSLSLMISTLTCSSIEDARSAVEQLTSIVRQLVESNENTNERLDRMESKRWEAVSVLSRTTRNSVQETIIEDDESAITVRQLQTGSPPWDAREVAAPNYAFDFERLLESSRPYVRAFKRPQPPASATSSVIQTLGWSCLSGISLAEVSNISIIELTVDKEQLWNSAHYNSRYGYVSAADEGRINKPLPALPNKRWGEAMKYHYPSRYSISANCIREVREGSKSEGRHYLLNNGTGLSEKLTFDLSAEKRGDDWAVNEDAWPLRAAEIKPISFSAARETPRFKERGRPRAKSVFRPLSELTNRDDVRLDSIRPQISAPVMAENSLGF